MESQRHTDYPYPVRANYSAWDAAAKRLGHSRRQAQVLCGLLLRFSHTEIAAFLRIRPETVKTHVARARLAAQCDTDDCVRRIFDEMNQPPLNTNR